jgi:hypothetical protein
MLGDVQPPIDCGHPLIDCNGGLEQPQERGLGPHRHPLGNKGLAIGGRGSGQPSRHDA